MRGLPFQPRPRPELRAGCPGNPATRTVRHAKAGPRVPTRARDAGTGQAAQGRCLPPAPVAGRLPAPFLPRMATDPPAARSGPAARQGDRGFRPGPLSLRHAGGLPMTLPRQASGGSGGIRTHERLSPLLVFKTSAFNHSATLPASGPALSQCLTGAICTALSVKKVILKGRADFCRMRRAAFPCTGQAAIMATNAVRRSKTRAGKCLVQRVFGLMRQ